MRNKVDWSTEVFTWDGPDDIIRFCQHNQTLFETVLKAVFSDSPPTGSESTGSALHKNVYVFTQLCTVRL